jgi:putative membrane protein insertion efficiency factor
VAATPFLWLITFYQRAISPLDGDRCSMHPTCSQYSVQAIRRHGPVIGIVMTVDRLIHEGDEQRHAVMARVGDRFRFDDPVSNNDFWWHGE